MGCNPLLQPAKKPVEAGLSFYENLIGEESNGGGGPTTSSAGFSSRLTAIWYLFDTCLSLYKVTIRSL
jgi:hypothetical protein